MIAAARTPSRTPAQQLGDAAETTVAALLLGSGWTVVGRNLGFGRNEVDILAVDPAPPATLVIVEVRWRASRGYGLAEETFDWRKRAHLRAAVGKLHEMTALADGTSVPRLPIRIDSSWSSPAGRVSTTCRSGSATIETPWPSRPDRSVDKGHTSFVPTKRTWRRFSPGSGCPATMLLPVGQARL